MQHARINASLPPTRAPVQASPAAIEEAAALLRAGKLVAFPTETVYGLGADAAIRPQPASDLLGRSGEATGFERAERAALAILRFRADQAGLMLGGRFADVPLLIPAGIERDAVRIDPVQGLLGLAVVGKGALLDDDAVRAAINMAIDRSQLPNLFPLGGWTALNAHAFSAAISPRKRSTAWIETGASTSPRLQPLSQGW